MDNTRRIALLIDCDNVSHQAIEGVLEELATHGTVNVRHAHGNWKSTALDGWAKQLHPHAIRPMQQFAYTKGKNATDSAMIIDAMDLVYGGNVDAFALMTSDSDFTPLVLRLVEGGFPVYGFGSQKTPKPFVDACSPFIYIENLMGGGDDKDSGEPAQKKSKDQLQRNRRLVRMLRTGVEQTSGDDGWANVGAVASYVSNNNPSFAPINFGYRKFSELVKATGLFKIEMRNQTAMYISDKRGGG